MKILKTKITTIIAALAVVVVLGMVLTACGNVQEPNNSYSTTTISLAEAKVAIVNALALDNNLHTQAVEDTGNRNPFEKLQKYKISYKDETNYYDHSVNYIEKYGHLFEGKFLYRNGKYMKSLCKRGSQDDTHEWWEYDAYASCLNSEFGWSREIEDGSINEIGLQYVTYGFESIINLFEDCFTDSGFSLYDDQVQKISFGNSYTMVLSMPVEAGMNLLSVAYNLGDVPDAVRAKICPKNTFEIMVGFNNDEIVSMKLTINYASFRDGSNQEKEYRAAKFVCDCFKYDGEITEPEWLLDYLASQQN